MYRTPMRWPSSPIVSPRKARDRRGQEPPEPIVSNLQRVPKRSNTKPAVNPADVARRVPIRTAISDYGE